MVVTRTRIEFEQDIADFRLFVARIEGVTPLLMNNPRHSMGNGGAVSATRKSVPKPEEEAATKLYRHPDGWLYIGADHVRESMLWASKGLRVNRKPLQPLLAASLFIIDEYFPLTRNGQLLYEPDRIDIRRAVVQRQGVLRARGLIDVPWQAEVRFQYDASIITNPEIMVQVLKEAGMRIGILDYRPQKGGVFGRFAVAEAWVESL